MKRKGFTLIELLAVIAVLAIITSIATPIVFGIINDTKEESIKKSVILYMDSIEKNIAKQQTINPDYEPDECIIQENGNVICSLEDDILEVNNQSNELEIAMKGIKPTSGILKIKDGKIIEILDIYLNHNYVNYDDENNIKLYLNPTEAGLYDKNRNLLATWKELENFGFNVLDDHFHPTDKLSTAFRTIINEHSELEKGSILVIPGEVEHIGSYVFYDSNNLTNVIILDGVKEIHSAAFANCKNLSSITMPNSITSIGSHAFSKTKLSKITLSSNLANIGDHAFNNTKLSSIVIPSSVNTISSGAFAASSLSSIKVDSQNKIYEDRNSNAIIEKETNKLIAGCKNTTIPNNITSIGDSAFEKSGITRIIIPSSITSIGNSAFALSSVESITIPDGITTIGNSTFNGCSKLTNITIPSSVTSIGSWAFQGCNNLTSIVIPSGVNKINYKAFDRCSALKTVTFENTTGWFITNNPDATTGNSINLSNPETNATNLVTKYVENYWRSS